MKKQKETESNPDWKKLFELSQLPQAQAKNDLNTAPNNTQYWYPIYPTPCPGCGHCPTCGRRNVQPHYPSYPYYPYITWTVNENIYNDGHYVTC